MPKTINSPVPAFLPTFAPEKVFTHADMADAFDHAHATSEWHATMLDQIKEALDAVTGRAQTQYGMNEFHFDSLKKLLEIAQYLNDDQGEQFLNYSLKHTNAAKQLEQSASEVAQ